MFFARRQDAVAPNLCQKSISWIDSQRFFGRGSHARAVPRGGGSLWYINAPFEGALQWGTLLLPSCRKGTVADIQYVLIIYVCTFIYISIFPVRKHVQCAQWAHIKTAKSNDSYSFWLWRFRRLAGFLMFPPSDRIRFSIGPRKLRCCAQWARTKTNWNPTTLILCDADASAGGQGFPYFPWATDSDFQSDPGVFIYQWVVLIFFLATVPCSLTLGTKLGFRQFWTSSDCNMRKQVLCNKTKQNQNNLYTLSNRTKTVL